MVALATATVRLRLDTSGVKDDIEKGLRGAGGDKAANARGRSLGASFSKGFGDGGSTFGRVAATMASRAAIAASAVAAATPVVTQFVAALAPAAGAAAGLVPAVAAAAAITGTFKLAISGVSDAIKAGLTGSAKQYQKALDGLTPAQRAVTRDVVALKGQMEGLRQTVAQRFFAPLVADIRPLATSYLPVLRTGMGGLAGDLGRVSAEVLAAARTAPVVNALRGVFASTSGAVRTLRGDFGPLIQAVARLVSSSLPLLGSMSGMLDRLIARTTGWINSAARSGLLVSAFNNAVGVIRNLLAIFSNLGAITAAVFRTATGGTNTFLQRLVTLTGQVRAFVTSANGTRTVAAAFQTLGVVGEAVRRSLGGILPQIGASLRIAAPAAAAFATQLSRMIVALGPLLPALTRVSVQLLTALIPAMSAFAGWLERNQGLVRGIAPYIVAFAVASRAVSTALIIASAATRAWAVVVGVAKGAQAVWTAVTWLSVAPVHAHTAAMRLSQSTIGTWIGVKAIEARAWLSGVANTVRDTAAKVANRAATLGAAAASRVMAGINAVGTWVASAVAVTRDTAAKVANRVATLASAAATGIATVAMRVWTVATVAGSVAMRAAGVALRFMTGPIGLAITAIGLITAAIIYLWKNNQTFRTIVLAVWKAVQAAISAVGNWFRSTLVPLIKAGVDAIAAYYRFLWSIVRTIWSGILAAIRLSYQGAVAIFQGLRTWVTVTIPTGFRSMVTIVRTVLATFVAGVRAVWDSIRTGSFAPLRTFITQTLPAAFRTGVGAITAAWNAVQAAARKPVVFVVDHVINPLVNGYNAIAKVFGAPTASTIKLARGGLVSDQLPGFASGGRVPGAPSSVDNRLGSIVDTAGRFLSPLKVATGEFIVNARDTAKALPLLRWVNSGMKGGPHKAAEYIGRRPADMPGDGSEGFAFAGGGLVGFIKDVWGAVSNPANLIKKPVEAAINAIPGSGFFRSVVVGLGKKLLAGMMSKVSGLGGGGGTWNGVIAPGAVGKAQRFVQAQNGKPYVWASAGPGGYDCSGIVSAAYNVLHGRNPYSHTFSTGSLPGPWFDTSRKVGPLVGAWSHPGQRPASSGTGHMMGSIGGMTFESTGSKGVHIGGTTRRITDFHNIGVARAHGGLIEPMRLMDRGGRWPSGTAAVNLSGNTEHVLTGGPHGDIAEMISLLRVIADRLGLLGGELADALERPTRRAVQLGRSRGVVVGRATT